MVILFPSKLITQDSVLSIRLPSLVNLRQSKEVIWTEVLSQASSAVAVNEIGVSGGTILRALHEIFGPVVSNTETVVVQVAELPEASVAV